MPEEMITSVLFVCTANQCRSPMAEVMMRNWLEQKGRTGSWRVASAGIDASPGIPATGTAQRAMLERGIDLNHHRSQQVSEKLLAESDIILVMEDWHKTQLLKEFPAYADKVCLIRERAGLQGDVDDPVGLPLDEYRKTADELQSLIITIFQEQL